MVGVGCSQPVPTSDAWTYDGTRWTSQDSGVTRLTVEHVPPGTTTLTLRAPESVPSGTVLDAMITATQAGVLQFHVGAVEGDGVDAGLPPPPTAARDFAVVHVGPSGVRLSAPGGAEHHVSCGVCEDVDDWSMSGLGEALTASGTAEVLVTVSPSVPWGAVLAAFETSGSRTLRIAREQ